MTDLSTLPRRRFGRTNLEVSPVGFGGAEIGLLGQEQDHVTDLLNRLLDLGINVIDTAAMYRVSEELIGNAIAARRDEYVLISKCGHEVEGIDGPAWSASLVAETVDRALRRLKTDHLDVMLLHSCELDVLEQGDALGALVEAREAGKVRYVGYSGDNDALDYAAALPEVAVVQTSISICDQANIDGGLALCREHDVAVMAKRPIANAAWKKAEDMPGGYANYAKDYMDRLQRMGISPADFGLEANAWAELFLRFTLSLPGVHTAIIGTTNPAHVQSNLAAATRPLDDEAIGQLREAFRAAEAAAGERWEGLR
jgi:aryl-alcohol dehydrogenase-like predicted oxidoreductase